MSNQKYTIYQRLTKMFGYNGQPIPTNNSYNFSKNELLKTDSKDEYDKTLLQSQQSQYITDKWAKLDQSLYNQSVYYEANRLAAYYDFESMEFTPEISAALDIFSEESTQMSEKGEMLTIFSESDRIKSVLEDLFKNKLDINTNLQMWTRGMCKYGDDFVYLKIDPNEGIIGCQQLPNIEIERIEGGSYLTNKSDNMNQSRELRFAWKNRDMEFQNWEIAHFRLLGDDRKLPYGTCLKYNTRIETENGVKEIKDIVVGDMVWSFDTKTQTKVLSKVLDTVNSGNKDTFKISTKHNFIDVSKEHRIMFYNKDTKSFDYKNTLDFNIGDLLVVSKISNNNINHYIDKTKPLQNFNGYWNNINLIPDIVTNELAELYGYMLGDGWLTNTSVAFALSIHKTINEKYISILEKLSGKKVKFSGGENDKAQGICNSKMLKTIFERLDFKGKSYEKRIPEWVYNLPYDKRKFLLNGIIDADGSLFIDEWNCLRYTIELSNEELINDIKILVQSLGIKSGKICSRKRKLGKIGDRDFKTQRESFYFYFYESKVKQKTKFDIETRLTDDFIVEPVTSIVKSGNFETYDIYVENENHNFYANGVVVHNSILDKIRRIWKQLLLAEDAMLIYRTTRAPERRVFKVFVGNMDDKDIESYVQRVANKFKRDQVVDQKTGQVDMRYNQMPVWSKTPIPLLDGRTITIEELAKEYEEGKQNWVYSIQDKTFAVVPGKVIWCGKNYTANKLTKVWLDDETWVLTAPEHPFILRDGKKVNAEDLKEGDSLMPYYVKKSNQKDGLKIKDYDMIYNPKNGKYQFVHRLVSNSVLSKETHFFNKFFKTITDYIDEIKKNHKVSRIETIYENEDVYCMTVVGINGEEDRHNFALKSFKNDKIVSESGVFVSNSVDQDFFIPVRDIAQQNPIETLPGACISLETEIPLLDGRTLKLSEIINEWDNGNKDLWVYSANPLTGELAPGLITWAGITRKNTDVLKITLDNGEEIISTPDHKFVHRTNGFVEAKDLNIGDSLMPFYTKYEKINRKTNEYQKIWDSDKQEWVFTHRMVCNFLKNHDIIKEMIFDEKYNILDKKVIHHKNLNRYDNNPLNLVKMNGADHMKYHQSVIKETIWKDKDLNKEKISKGLKKHINNLTEEQKKKRFAKNIFSENSIRITTKKLIEWRKNEVNNKKAGKLISKAFTDNRKKEYSLKQIERMNNPIYKAKVFTKKQTITFSDEIYNNFLKVFETNLRADKTLKILNNDSEFMSLFISINKDIRSSLTNLNEFTLNHVDKMFKLLGYKNFCDWKKSELKKRGFKNMVAWKYYVDKQNKLYNHKITDIEYLEEKLDTGTITVDNSEIYHNYHTFAIKSGVFIKNSNLGEIQDIEYLQKKMLAALRVPKAFLGFEDVVGEGKSLALMDIRFARTINKVQKSLIHELNKIALLHLLILGFEDELNNFTLSLTNPSSQSDLLKIEQWKEKITLYKDATSDQSQLGILPVSHTWAKKNILGMSESEVLLDLQQQRLERALGFELSNTQQVIKRTRVFDQVDAKYGISEEDRKKLDATADTEGGDSMGLGSTAPSAPTDGGEALSEDINLFSVIKDKEDLIFDNNKSTDIINELNDKIKDIIK